MFGLAVIRHLFSVDCFKPRIAGLFAKELGRKLFAISSYIGEVVIKNTRASKWETSDNDPNGEINIRLVSANGTTMFPGQRVLKRIQNGEQDNIYDYTAMAVKKYMEFEGEIPKDFLNLSADNSGKPWWKFW